MDKVTHVLFLPKFQGSLWGLSHVSDLMAFQKPPELCVRVLVQSSMISYWLTEDLLSRTSHGQIQCRFCKTKAVCEMRWEETDVLVLHSGMVVQGLVFIVEECEFFLQKMFLRFWRSFPDFSLEERLCFCSSVLCAPLFVSAPCWLPGFLHLLFPLLHQKKTYWHSVCLQCTFDEHLPHAGQYLRVHELFITL